jgi:hypothetical protein
MSTPVNQLPNNVSNEVIQQNISQLEDPTIADVINEMEREVTQQQQRPPPPQQMQQGSPPQYAQPAPPQYAHQQGQSGQQYAPQYRQQGGNGQQVQHFFQQQYPAHYSQNGSGFFGNQYASWINTPHAQRAILAAIIAAFIFYPFETGVIYEKIPFLSNMHQHDRLIRTLLLAVVLYCLLLKLNI